MHLDESSNVKNILTDTELLIISCFILQFFLFQQTLISIAGNIVLPLLVAEAACALEDGVFIRKLFSTTFFLSGITTFMQVMFGVRLPLYQGPTSSYAVPIIALNKMDASRCDVNAMCKF